MSTLNSLSVPAASFQSIDTRLNSPAGGELRLPPLVREPIGAGTCTLARRGTVGLEEDEARPVHRFEWPNGVKPRF